MPRRYQFPAETLRSVVGGLSALDMPRLSIKSLEEAQSFIAAYGFSDTNEHREKLWYFHRRALVLLTERLGFTQAEIPTVLQDRKELQDLRRLLLWASSIDPQESELQRWSCALLRAMHVFVHSEMDLFSTFSEEIQKQILTPFQDCIVHDGGSSRTILKNGETGEEIILAGFETKPFKTSSSTVIKLLAKRDTLAMNIFDKLGVRFITRSMFDTFKVVRFLIEENLIGFPHVIPEQSSNNLYPVDVFLQACAEIPDEDRERSPEEMQEYFDRYLEENKADAAFLRKENAFSGQDYRFIKFIARRLIHIPAGEDHKKTFSFFYPFEVQILDESSHKSHEGGASQHQAYKERQRLAARARVMPQ
jgi:uncharacterized protein (TIGR04552 family)